MKNTWLFPIVQSLHVVGLALAAGTVVLSDYRVLRGGPVERQAGWFFTGLLLLFGTGAAMFFSDASRYWSNPAFLVKLGLVAFALGSYFLVRRRSTALLSLALWTAVVVASRLVEDFDK